MAESRTVSRVGTVRPSQLMYSAGVGALVDLPGFSVIVGGLDGWDGAAQMELSEDRLLAAVRARFGKQVKELRQAPWEEETRNPYEHWAGVGVPALPFPRWLRCTRCDLLSTIEGGLFTLKTPSPYRPDLTHYEHSNCTSRGAPPYAIPARFVTACPAGHLDEFPWETFCHTDHPCSGKPMLRAHEIGSGSRSTDMLVVCSTCEAKRSLARAFGSWARQTMPYCRGRHPHLQWFDPAGCKEPARAMLLGASNQWFPVTETVLSLPVSPDPLAQIVAELWGKLSDVPNREALDYALKHVTQLHPLAGHAAERVWDAVQARRRERGAAEDEALDLRGPEWTLFAEPARVQESRDFKLTEAGTPPGFAGRVERVVLAERLREVVALWGFTRVDSPDSGVAGDAPVANVAPLCRDGKPAWVPAAEVRGEGIFVQLPEAAVAKWVDKVAGSDVTEALRESHKRWRTRHGLDAGSGWPGERFVLMHSLAHCLLNQLALECGYSAASIRERIYANEPEDGGQPTAGFLLYTSASDSEGTLGGLVGLGEPATLSRMLSQALERAGLCSADPFCAEHTPAEDEDSLHNAACHACLFVPETSCERGNRYLDRNVLVPTLRQAPIAYFDA